MTLNKIFSTVVIVIVSVLLHTFETFDLQDEKIQK